MRKASFLVFLVFLGAFWLFPGFSSAEESLDPPPLPAYAAPPIEKSLFFSGADLAAIETLVAQNPSLNERRREDLLTLDAILYYGDAHWSLWINGVKWTPDTTKTQLKILNVQPDEATIEAKPLLGGTPQKAVLHPHESYDLVTGEVH